MFRYMDSPTSDHRIVFESGAEHDPGVAVRVEAVENVLWLVLDVIPDRVDGAS